VHTTKIRDTFDRTRVLRIDRDPCARPGEAILRPGKRVDNSDGARSNVLELDPGTVRPRFLHALVAHSRT
jgi:hypothetical protein